MGIELNHTIVWSHDKVAAAGFLTAILGLPDAVAGGHFQVVGLANGVSLDFADADGDVAMQHYAFWLSEAEFDAAFARIRARRLEYWADPARTRPHEIYQHRGGRGLYFRDPSGHLLEILTWRDS
jgi:catechol 2,3-dioxygenase-like lactoylglutathione lyase family enzyme